MNNEDPILTKIKALLRLTVDRGATKSEMETAIAMAHKIALKHKIDLANLSVDEQLNIPLEEIINDAFVTGYKAYPESHIFVSDLLTRFFNVKCCELPGFKLSIVGTRSDVDMAIFVYEYLRAEFKRMWYVYQLEECLDDNKSRDSFYLGLYRGLKQKLDDSQAEVFKETGCTAIVLVDHKRRVDDKFALFFPNTRKVNRGSIKATDANAVAAGTDKGKNINLRKPIK